MAEDAKAQILAQKKCRAETQKLRQSDIDSIEQRDLQQHTIRMTTIDLIFLDKCDSNCTADWKYYRVTPLFGIHIETCELKFPKFEDVGIPIQTPFVVGLASAYDIKQALLGHSGIDQDRATQRFHIH